MKRHKVFGIGFHRTGTTSLQTGLEELGYSVIGMRPREWRAYASGDYEYLLRTVENFDGFRDMPWPLLYEFLYKNVPDAKFILTYRAPESWAQSCTGNYKSRPHEMFPVIYGFEQFEGNETRAKAIYSRHLDAVRAFFSDKPGVFLEHDFTADPSWARLCEFLLEPVPARPFPHANRRPQALITKAAHKVFRKAAPTRYKKWVRDRT